MKKFFAAVFLSPDDRRLRAGWRLVLHTLLFFLFSAALTASLLLLSAAVGWLPSGSLRLGIEQVIELFSLTFSVWFARRYLDRRSFVSLGLSLDAMVWRDLLAGVLITGVMMGTIFALHLLFGWMPTVTFAWQSMSWPALLGQLGFWLLIFLVVAWKEELWMRGYWLQNLANGLNVPWAVFLSSALFGMLHLGNPNATWVSALGIMVSGVFLALPWVWTRRLWLSIGLHLGWNFFEGAIFGFPVSGLDTFRLIQPVIRGPEMWTGARFGPEAGLVLLPAILLGTALVWAYTQRYGRSESSHIVDNTTI